MAVVAKRFFKGQLVGTASNTLYTVPTNTNTMVKAVTITNPSTSPATFYLVFAGVQVIAAYTIKGNDTITIPFMDQILLAGETITAQASIGLINLYISGKEVT